MSVRRRSRRPIVSARCSVAGLSMVACSHRIRAASGRSAACQIDRLGGSCRVDDSHRLQLSELLADAAAGAPMPAVAVAVITADGASVQSIRGMANVESGECVTPDHWWDLASLTKVLVTAPEVLAMVDSGALALADRLAAVWPRASGTPLAPVTVAQLLDRKS